MKCFYHPSKDSAAQCSNCGKYLCRTCADHWGGRLCTDCVKSLAAQKRNGFLLSLLAVTAVTAAVFYLLYFKIAGNTARDMYNAVFGIGVLPKVQFCRMLCAACIPAGLFAAKGIGRAFAEKYDIRGKAAVACLVAVLLAGILLGWVIILPYLIWLLYNVIKYNVTVKAARGRLRQMAGKKRKKR